MTEISQRDLVVVIRSAHERTLELCRSLLLRQVAASSVHIVELVPFEAALLRCYEIGLNSGTKWMLTVDADVLLKPGSVERLILSAQKMPTHYAQLEGRIFDKVFGVYRQAGHRVYRTSVLPLAIKCIPPEGEQIRPEYFTLQKLASYGHPSRRISDVVGIHDFEQYHRDLYRKSFVHAKKHDYLALDLIRRCSVRKTCDPDFHMILRGFWDGLMESGRVSIDTRKFATQADQAIAEIALHEKERLDPIEIIDWEAWIAAKLEYEPPELATQDEPSDPQRPSALTRLRELHLERGWPAVMRYSVGRLLIKIGQTLAK